MSDDEKLAAEANRLYWKTDRSVNQIAEDLGVSKGSLYGMVRSLSAGIPCPECGEEMGYAHRTAHEKGRVVCPECELEEDESSVRAEWQAVAAAEGGVVVTPPSGAVRGSAIAGADEGYSVRIVLGSALLGLAAGIAIGSLGRDG